MVAKASNGKMSYDDDLNDASKHNSKSFLKTLILVSMTNSLNESSYPRSVSSLLLLFIILLEAPAP